MELVVLKKHGESIRGLSRSTGRSRNTVRRYLRDGEGAKTRKPAPKRAEKLDAYKDYIVARVKAAAPDRIPATVLFREIKARGYVGGETRVKQFVRGLVPAAEPDPVVRYETEPGHQMQADWATVGRGTEKLKEFIATLGWSRVAYVEFCDDERVETLIGCHENAFVSFGGVPAEVLYDNALRALRPLADGSSLRAFERAARDMGCCVGTLRDERCADFPLLSASSCPSRGLAARWASCRCRRPTGSRCARFSPVMPS